MSFRTVVVTKQSKLSYKNRFLVIKQEEDERYIHLSEVDTIIVDSISVSISTYLLKELSDNKINIIFCDERHNPFGELSSYYSRHNSSKKIKTQIQWKQKEKDILWSEIVKNKIMYSIWEYCFSVIVRTWINPFFGAFFLILSISKLDCCELSIILEYTDSCIIMKPSFKRKRLNNT